ncbi:glutathione S-transferase kappa 1-like [Tigriopus californicus]|uniref:glutathione S-transferase kappa 1-like n=1 Tax=Tigriopus californicus TaxID=6832 RepID=UPI0027D9F129|nr:glutathione S-transferase kappa 1-like [Tigriopus californicus]XP_059094199.1 glutathione S-transferase kappa 1-like [Tigriopus californicus]
MSALWCAFSGQATRCRPVVQSAVSQRSLSGTCARAAAAAAVYKSPVRVDFYYDTISPYSWLAFETLLRYRPVWNLEIQFKPVFMAGLSQATSSNFLESLTKNQNKTRHMFQDIVRMGQYFKVPLRIPESPFYMLAVVGSLKQQRFLTAAQMKFPDVTEDLSRSIWYRGWAEDLDIAKPDSLRMIGRRAGMSEEEVEEALAASETQEVKDRLKSVTREAVDDGACGLPFLVFHVNKGDTDVETYFGSDRFPVIAHRLDLEWNGPVPDPNNFKEIEEPAEISKCFLSIEQYDELNQKFVDNVKQDFNIKDK